MIRRFHKDHKFYELGLLETIKELDISGTYVDVGANIGNHAIFFANFCKCNKLICVEAHKEICEVLKINVDKHVKIPTTIINSAMVDKLGFAEIGPINPGNVGSTRVLEVRSSNQTNCILLGDIIDNAINILNLRL